MSSKRGIRLTMINYADQLAKRYYDDQGSRLVSARTLEELKCSMLARYPIIKTYTQSTTPPLEDYQQKNKDYFEQNNPGHSADFTTTWNSFGMRQPYEILPQVDCCFYGCSMTWGLAVPDHVIWPKQLADQLGWRYNNFAISSVGIDECVNLFIATSRMVKMRTAIFMFPHSSRITQAFSSQDKIDFFTIYSQLAYNKTSEEFNKNYFSLPEEFFYDKILRNLEIITTLAQLKGINVLISTWGGERLPQVDGLNIVKIKSSDMDKNGLDKKHPGCQWHSDTAQHFQQALKEAQCG